MNRTFPSFYMDKDNRGDWYWIFHARNGEAIARSSESYRRRVDCEHSIDIMKAATPCETWMPTNLLSAA